MPHPCILDTETTGKVDPEPIEIGLIDLYSGADFIQRYRPSKRIEYGALATHHILDEELVGLAPSSSFLLPRHFTHMIGHAVEYDWTVIGKPAVGLICTHALARDIWREIDSHSLGALMYYLERNDAREWLREAHSALADCQMTRVLLQHICAVLGLPLVNPTTWGTLEEMTKVARIPAYIEFGKYKGRLFADVPSDYKAWYFRQPDQDPIVVEAMQNPRLIDLLGRTFPAQRE